MGTRSRDGGGSGPGTVEMIHKWSADDGGEAIGAFVEAFDRTHSATLEDRSVETLGLEVKSRILQEVPPDCWMSWPGRNLEPYYGAEVLQTLDPVWERTDMERAYADGVRDIATLEGEYTAVPTNVHRINNLFYRVEAAERAGVDPGRVSDPRELVEVIEQLEDALDVLGMVHALKNPTNLLQLWAQTFLGQYGPEEYRALTGGEGTRYRSQIGESLEIVRDMADLAQEDVLFTDFGGASAQFVDGTSALFTQGDWAGGLFTSEPGFAYGRDWDHVPYPGTEGVYQVVLDGAMATTAADLDGGAGEFLEFAGSARGQAVFNEPKGSIPPRTDVDLRSFSPFLQDQYEDFQRARAQPGTIAHGLAVSPSQHIELMNAMTTFLSEWDCDATAEDLVAVFEE